MHSPRSVFDAKINHVVTKHQQPSILKYPELVKQTCTLNSSNTVWQEFVDKLTKGDLFVPVSYTPFYRNAPTYTSTTMKKK